MKRYESLNGLRTIACIGIIMMHVKANISYTLPNESINKVINSFTQFVYLFFIISSFAMCCGYYDKIKNNEISMNDFYKKRLRKIFPFFSILVLLDIVMERTIPSMYEGFMDLTLLFGLLPVNRSVSNRSSMVFGSNNCFLHFLSFFCVSF